MSDPKMITSSVCKRHQQFGSDIIYGSTCENIFPGISPEIHLLGKPFKTCFPEVVRNIFFKNGSVIIFQE